jgi:hypothetical protein
MQLMLGHDGPPTNHYRENLVSGAPLMECPLRTVLRARESKPVLVREIDRYLDEHYPNYEAGFLLNEGGAADQPARYATFMTTIRAMRAAQHAKWEEINRPPEPESSPVSA